MPTPNEQPKEATPSTPEQSAPAQQPQVIQQYVVTEQSLKGLGGWLVFWIVVFSLASVGYLMAFAGLLVGSDYGSDSVTGARVLGLIFTPLLFLAYLAASVLIIMQKKMGRLAALVTLGISALYTVLGIIVGYASSVSASSYYSSASEKALPVVVASIFATLIMHGLIGLYFVVSKRAKETLVN